MALGYELGISRGVFAGHSVSAMIGVLAVKKAPEMFEDLVMVGPSPRYINDREYFGGFTETQIHELLDFLDSNYMGWSEAMAPVIMGNPDRPELGEELTNSFCRIAPQAVGDYVHRTPPRSELVVMKATGHCPNLSAPDETIAAMRTFL